MNAQKLNNVRRQRRKTGIRKKLFGSAAKPRLSIFRSSKHMYAQLIDDFEGKTLAAKAAGIDTVAFDRNGFKFHGRVKALADAAREGGLKF